jgi:hypothetical protein
MGDRARLKTTLDQYSDVVPAMQEEAALVVGLVLVGT